MQGIPVLIPCISPASILLSVVVLLAIYLWQHLWASLWRILRGLFWAIVFGVPLGVALATVPPMRMVLEPYVDFLRATLAGVRRIPTEYLESARSLGAGRLQLVLHTMLPSTVPDVLT